MEDFFICEITDHREAIEKLPVVLPAVFLKSSVKLNSTVFRHINYTKTVLAYLKILYWHI